MKHDFVDYCFGLFFVAGAFVFAMFGAVLAKALFTSCVIE